MPAPSPLKVATQAVTRLTKENEYYRKELASQTERVKQLEERHQSGGDADSNAEFMLKQERKAVEETKAVFEPLKKRIAEAVQRLEEAIATSEDGGDAEELNKAKEVLAAATVKSDEA